MYVHEYKYDIHSRITEDAWDGREHGNSLIVRSFLP